MKNSIPLDAVANVNGDTHALSYQDASQQNKTLTNRITTAGYEYDPAGNQTRGQTENGTWRRYKYDAAGRLAVAMDDGSNPQETYSYGASNERLMTVYGKAMGAPATYYCWEGGQVVADYRAGTSSNLVWEKSYVYLGGRLLATTDLYGTKYHHPDRLGTRLVTDGANGTVTTEQVNLPYGTALTSESSGAISNRRFTSYDRSATTGMDYAVNRFYNPAQGRFTQVDPIGMGAVRLGNPQSLNLYGYCENDPINHVDPDGLFLGKLFGWIGNAIKKVAKVFAVVLAVAAVLAFSWGFAAIGVAALIGSGIYAAIGWGNGKLAQLAAGIAFPGSSYGGFKTPSTFPNGASVGGVSNFLQQQNPRGGKLVPLSGQLLIDFNTARNAAISLLGNPKSDCAKFLKSHGFNPVQLASILSGLTPYDGLKSTNEDDFGILSGRVNRRFKELSPDALTNNPGTRIYFSSKGITTTIQIHETLHVIKPGIADRDILKQLGGTDAEYKSDGPRSINKKLEQGGCK